MPILDNLSNREFILLLTTIMSISILIILFYLAFTYYELTDSLMRGQRVYLERLLELETDEDYRTIWNFTLNVVQQYEDLDKNTGQNQFSDFPKLLGGKK